MDPESFQGNSRGVAASAAAGPSGAFQMERLSIGPGFASSLHTQTVGWGGIEPAKDAQGKK